jgi:hypothetical protein
VREPVNGVGNADGVGGEDPYIVAAVVMEARADVVTSSRVDRESFTAFSTLVCVDFDAWRSKRCFVEIESTVDLSVGG